jgi:alpha,alpha-trehalose phosphorylase
MARENLRYAAQTIESLRATHPDSYGALMDKTALAGPEADEWIRGAESIYVPYDEKLKIVPQDDSFLDREPGTSRTHRPTITRCCIHQR